MDIGHKIKQLRIQKGLTLEELASRSELTKGFLSQTERNLTSPSIAILNDIVEALGTSLSEFFKEDKEERIVFRKRDFFVDERDHCTVNWIVPNTQKNEMEPILLELPQGGESFAMDPPQRRGVRLYHRRFGGADLRGKELYPAQGRDLLSLGKEPPLP